MQPSPSIPARAMALAMAFLLLAGTASSHADAGDEAVAKQLIQAAVSDALQAYGGRSLSPDERRARLAELIDRYGDMTTYSEDVLGRYWTRASASERVGFGQLLGQYLPGCWGSSLTDMPSSLHVDFAATETLANGRMVIHSLAVVPNDTLAIDWTIAWAADGHPIVADAAVDGISVLQTIQSDFLSFLHANGGRLDALFEALQRKIASPRNAG